MNNLETVIDHKKRRRFTDREDETRLFGRLLEHTYPEYHALAIYGLGGIGKSTLLDEFEQMCHDRGIPVARIDGSIPQNIVKVARSIRSQLSGRKWLSPFRQFDSDLRRYLEIQGKIEKSEVAQQVVKTFSAVGGLADPTGLYNKLGKETIQTGLSALFSFLSRPDVDFYIQADILLARRLIEGLDRAEPQKLVIMLDAYERLPTEVQNWVAQSFAPKLSERTILVIAGRSRLSGPWAEWETAGILRQIEIVSFDKASAKVMLAKRGITEENFINEVFEFTQGHPLCIALAAEIGIEPDKKIFVMKGLIERVLDQITDPQLANLLQLCAVPRYFNQDIMDCLSGTSFGLDKGVAQLEEYSFIKPVERGFVMHEAVRDYLIAQLAQRSPTRYRELHERMLGYFRQALAKASPAEWSEIAIEVVYHQLSLSEQDGMRYCIDLFTIVDSTLDLQFAASMIRELEQFSFRDLSVRQWPQAFKARYAYLQRDWPKAAEGYRLLLDQATEPELKLMAMNGLSRVYGVMNRLDEGLFYGEKGLDLAQALGHEDGLLDALYNVAQVKQRQGVFQQGIELLEGRVPGTATNYRQASLLDMLGLLYRSQGRLDEATRCHERARSVWDKLGSQYRIAAEKYLMSAILCRQCRWAQAITQLKEALIIFERLVDDAWIGRCMSLLGEAEIGAGNIDEGINLVHHSISIREVLGDTYGLISDHEILGSAYACSQKYGLAISHYEQALTLSHTHGNHALEANALLGLASAYLELIEKPKALEYAQLAVEVAQEFHLTNVQTEALNLMGKTQTK